MKAPENDVTIRRNADGGVTLLVDGHDLAPHATSWRLEGQGDQAPELTVTIPCGRVHVDLGDTAEPTTVPVPQDPPSVTAARRDALVRAGKEDTPWPAR